MENHKLALQLLDTRVARLERIIGGDAATGTPGLVFTMLEYQKDMADVKNTLMTMTGVLSKLHLERAKLIGAGIALWTTGLFVGWLVNTFIHK